VAPLTRAQSAAAGGSLRGSRFAPWKTDACGACAHDVAVACGDPRDSRNQLGNRLLRTSVPNPRRRRPERLRRRFTHCRVSRRSEVARESTRPPPRERAHRWIDACSGAPPATAAWLWRSESEHHDTRQHQIGLGGAASGGGAVSSQAKRQTSVPNRFQSGVRQTRAAAVIVSSPAERPICRGAKLSGATAVPPSRVPRATARSWSRQAARLPRRSPRVLAGRSE
jgi:hypothetical protein